MRINGNGGAHGEIKADLFTISQTAFIQRNPAISSKVTEKSRNFVAR
jgi:hypothetical protein